MKTWALPDAPGHEVTAVRDARNWRWTRHPEYPGYWSVKGRTDENGCYPDDYTYSFGELLTWCGPLTDATEDVE